MRASAVLVVVLGSVTPAAAQEVIDGPTTAVDFTGYAGAGLVASPAAGQLDSDTWRVAGLSGGDTGWGGAFATEAFARGAAPGMVSEGGLWAFTVAPGDVALGLQQTGGDLTPGDVVVRFTNATAGAVVDPTVRFEIWARNDSGRASSMAFSWSTDDAVYVPVAALDVVSTADTAAAPIWQVVAREGTLTGATLAPGATLHLRWHVDNAGGNGGYDELAIDDVEVDAPPPPIGDPDAGPGGGDEDPEDVDEDDDGVLDVVDNCPTVANDGQADDDADGVGDACDDFDRDGEASYGCAAGGDGGAGLAVWLLLAISARRRSSRAARRACRG